MDTKNKPIIHPVKDNPKSYLRVSNFYFYDKNDRDRLGEFTIERLELNDGERLAIDRYKLGLAVIGQLNDLTKEIIEILETKSVLTDRQKLKFSRKIRTIMQFGTAKKKYSAVISSAILTDTNYTRIKQLLKANNLWDDELNELDQQVIHCALI